MKYWALLLVAGAGLTLAAGVTDNLLLYASFDENCDAVVGTAKTAEAKDVTLSDGKFGKGARMENLAKLAYSGKGNLDLNEGTFALWIKRDKPWSEKRGYMILRAVAGKEWNQDGFYIAVTKWDELSVSQFDRDKKRNIVLSPNNIPYPANEWQHLVVTWQGPAVRIYMNGVEISYKTPSDPMREAPAGTVWRIQICSENSEKEALDGAIDEFRIYSKAMTPAEVKALYEFVP